MKIFIGSDHGGFHLKEKVFAYLAKHNYDTEDVGDKELDPNDDFPQFAQLAATKLIGSVDDDPRSILICTGGQGMAMAANRFRGVRACVIWNAFEAKECRNDNNSNILCLPARLLDDADNSWQDVVDTWLKTPFAGAARYARRNAQIDEF